MDKELEKSIKRQDVVMYILFANLFYTYCCAWMNYRRAKKNPLLFPDWHYKPSDVSILLRHRFRVRNHCCTVEPRPLS